MALINDYLGLFNFDYIEDVTEASLKKAFKKCVLNVHPDKGGSDEHFDKILTAYTYLASVVECIQTGKSTLQEMISPEELKEGRPAYEIINEIYDEIQNEDFNKRFEEIFNSYVKRGYHKSLVDGHGYGQYFKSGSGANSLSGADGLKREDIHIENIVKDNTASFNKIFEEHNKKCENIVDTLIIHPDELAAYSGQLLGTAIIEQTGGSYTSDMYTRPEYTDLYSAYTTDNVLYDKLRELSDRKISLDELINERNNIIPPLTDNEIEQFEVYKKDKQEEQKKHKEKIKNFYGGLLNVRDTLCFVDTTLDNTFGNMVIEIPAQPAP